MLKKILQSIINRICFYFSIYKYKKEQQHIDTFYLLNYEFDNDEISLDKIVRGLIKNVPFYDGYNNFDFKDFPITSKKEHIIKNLKNKLYYLKPRYKMNTGGSTGNPFQFLVSTRAGIIDSYHQIAQHKKMGFTTGDKLYVFNGCELTDNNLKNNIFWRSKKNNREMPFGSKEFSTHYLNIDNFKYYIAELTNNPPQYIRSYPSIFIDFTKLLLLFEYMIPPIMLKGVQLTSEVLSDNDKLFLENYWGNIIYLQYGHSEAATIATQFPNEKFYTFSPSYGFVEILDNDGNHVSENEEGRIVVTSYHNSVEPFIRYDTGDLAIFRSRKNGIVTVNKIIGRTQDFVFDKNKNKISVTGLVFGQHFKAFSNILNWQIINTDYGKLLVKIIKLESFTDENLYEIKNKLSFHDSFDVEILFVDEIKRTERGKHKLVINEISSNE